MGLLEGKTIAMTGGGGGLGRSYGVALAKAGASVAVSDIDVEAAQATTDAILEAGGRAITVKADVTQAAARIRSSRGILRALPGILRALSWAPPRCCLESLQ